MRGNSVIENLPASRSSNARFFCLQIRTAAAIEALGHVIVAMLLIIGKIVTLVELSLSDETNAILEYTSHGNSTKSVVRAQLMAIAILWIISLVGVVILHLFAFWSIRKRLIPRSLPNFNLNAHDIDTSHRSFLLLTIVLKVVFILASFACLLPLLDPTNFANMNNWSTELFRIGRQYNHLIYVIAALVCLCESISLLIEIKCFLFLREFPYLPIPSPRKIHVYDPPTLGGFGAFRTASQILRGTRPSTPANSLSG